MKLTRVPKSSDEKKLIFNISNLEMMRFVKNIVTMQFQKMPCEFTYRTRRREIAEVRQIYQFLLRERTSYSLGEIGYYTGGFTHCTVMHNVGAIKSLSETYDTYRVLLSSLNSEIDSKILDEVKLKIN